jgi:[ribosomal protein S5]-alanine N-acetyltransferase
MSDVVPGPYEPTFAPLIVPTLAAGPYRLRVFADSDVAAIEEASGDEQITEITTVPEIFTYDAGIAFLRRQHERARFADGYSFCLADGLSDRAIGSVGLWLRDAEFGRATIGYWVVPSARGKGAAGHGLQAIVTFAFDTLCIPRLQLHIEPWNAASIKTAEGQGFQREGLLRGFEQISGLQRDVYCYARLRADQPA